MKKTMLFWILLLLLLLVNCTTGSFDFGDQGGILVEGSGGGGNSQPNPAVPEGLEDLLGFTIVLGKSDRTTYGSMSKTVTSDDDFIENSQLAFVVTITCNGMTAAVGNGVSGVEVPPNGAHTVVNSTVNGVEYVLNGTTTNGPLKAYSGKKFELSLAGVSTLNPVGVIINAQPPERVFVVCADETTGVLTDGSSYTATTDGRGMKTCPFSEGQLIFSGGDSPAVIGNYKHAITSDDYMRLRSECNITVVPAKKDGIYTNESVIISGGMLNVSSDGDATQYEEGGVTMTGGFAKLSTTDNRAYGLKSCLDVIIDGGAIQAQVTGVTSKGISCDGNPTISGGRLTIFTPQTALYEGNDLSSCAGIKCDGNTLIAGGGITIQSTGGAGRGINCDGSIIINDGTVEVITIGTQCVYGRLNSSARGIKAGDALTTNGGTVLAKAIGGEGSEGIESKGMLIVNEGTAATLCYDDCMSASNSTVSDGGDVYCYSSGNNGIDSNGTLTITGRVIISSGTIPPGDGFNYDQNILRITGGIILGVGGGASTFTSSVCTQHTMIYGGSGSNREILNTQSADGTSVLAYQIPCTYSRMAVLFSGPSLTSGGSCAISKGGTVSGGFEFSGLYSRTTYPDGTQAATFTASSMVTQVDSTSGDGQSGGGGSRHRPGGWGW